MIMAKDSNNNYVKIEDIIKQQNNFFNGISPIKFKGSGENLENYRIYGNTVSGESVGDRTGNLFNEEYENANTHYVPIKVEDGKYTLSTTIPNAGAPGGSPAANIFLLAGNVNSGASTTGNGCWLDNPKTVQSIDGYVTIAYKATESFGERCYPWNNKIMLNEGSTPLPYEPYGYKVPVTVEGKNLLPNTVTSQTKNEVTFTVNSDGSVTCNGTANGGTALFWIPAITLPAGQYSINGCPVGGTENTTYKILILANNEWLTNDKGSGANFTLTETSTVSVRIAIYNGYTCDNLTFYPMIRKADIEDDTYEPYHAPVTTPIYLPEQIKKVGDEAEYVDYQEQKMHRVRKNLLKNTATSQTINGLTFTVNPIGSVTCNGRRENTSTFFTIGSVTTSGETILSGCLSGGSSTSFAMRAYSATTSNPRVYYDIGDGCMLNTPDTYNIDIRIQSDYTCDHLTFYPMIRKADIEDDTYEPYIENTDLDVTLPALPTLSGTNTLSVETNTKPSKVWGKLSDLRDILYVKDNLGNILFSKYHKIEGEPPLIYKAKKADTLTDYRIYGAEGNVGNLRPSLVAATDFTNGYHVATDGTIGEHGKRVATLTPIDVSAINTIYVNSGINTLSNPVIIYSLFSDDTFIERLLVNGIETVINTEGANKLYLSFGGESKVTTANLNNVYVMDNDKMYVIPVTIAGKNKFDGTLFNGYYTDSTMTSIGGTSGNYKSFKLFLSAGTYTFSCSIPVLIIRYITADSYKSNPTSGRITQMHTFTVSDDGYVSLAFRNAENTPWDDSTMIQIEEAQTATEYEPYHDPINTNIYLPEQIKMVGDKAEYIDFEEQKQHRVRKNLLKITSASSGAITYDGVSISNNDGILTLNGTSNNGAFVNLTTAIKLPIGNYILTGGSENPMIRFQKTFSGYGYDDTGAGRNFICPEEVTSGVCSLKLTANYTYNNVKVYPMIRKADITDDTYESYITSTELDVTLPALPTLSGINTLSVGTAVQPSKINIKGKIKGKIYGWHVDPDISNSSDAVTYLEDAREMFPASMRSTTFDYGSWENAFFMPKPCMLKSNGKVDYYLDPNDYTKKLDGTTSDIANPNYDGNAMMQWPKIWFKYVKGVKKGQGYFYVANYKADGNFHCWCNYDSEDNEIDHFYTAIYNGTSFANYNSSKTYVVNDFAIYDNKLYKCNTAIVTAESFDSTKWDIVSNTAPVINKMRSLSGIRLTNNNGNAQTDTTTEVTRATANNTTSAAEWYIETFSDRLLINGLLVLMGKSLNTQAVFGRGLDTGGQSAKEAYVTGALNDKGLFWGVIENGNSGVKIFGMENFWGCCWHRTAGLITNNHAVKLKLTYGTKDGSTVVGYNQTGNGYIDNGISPHSDGYVQKMSYNKYGFMPAVVTGGSQSTYYADYHYQNKNYTGIIYALFGGSSADGLGTGAFYLRLYSTPEHMFWIFAASLSCKPLLN